MRASVYVRECVNVWVRVRVEVYVFVFMHICGDKIIMDTRNVNLNKNVDQVTNNVASLNVAFPYVVSFQATTIIGTL